MPGAGIESLIFSQKAKEELGSPLFRPPKNRNKTFFFCKIKTVLSFSFPPQPPKIGRESRCRTPFPKAAGEDSWHREKRGDRARERGACWKGVRRAQGPGPGPPPRAPSNPHSHPASQLPGFPRPAPSLPGPGLAEAQLGVRKRQAGGAGRRGATAWSAVPVPLLTSGRTNVSLARTSGSAGGGPDVTRGHAAPPPAGSLSRK